MNSMEQVQENIKIADEGVPDSIGKDELLIYAMLRKTMGAKIKADCTDCRYCMPCTSGVDIPGVLAALNNAAIWNDTNPWMTGYTQVKGKAGKCTECRSVRRYVPRTSDIFSYERSGFFIQGMK